MSYISSKQISYALYFILCCLIHLQLSAQPWLRPALVSNRSIIPLKNNLHSIEDKFNRYWKDRNPSFREEENRAEGGYQQFKRWDWFMQQRTYPSGNPINPEVLFQAYQQYKLTQPSNRMNRSVANWQPVGPAAVPSSGGGSGRINVLRVAPGNNSVLYLGTACGGVWKSTNAGTNWTCLDDFLPSLSVADIAIKHCPDFDANCIAMRASSGGKYLSVTIEIYLETKEQINGLYADFNAAPEIKLVY